MTTLTDARRAALDALLAQWREESSTRERVLGWYDAACSAQDKCHDELAALLAAPPSPELQQAEALNATLTRERDEARKVGEDAAQQYNALLAAQRVTCAFCGTEYPLGTPRHGDGSLTEHILVCEQHPMRLIEIERDRLRAGLSGMIGASTREELEAMEVAIRAQPAPAEDKAAAIDAIHALLACLKAEAAPPSPGGTVIAEVVAERARQDAKWGGPSHDDTHSIFDWWGFIRQRMVVRLTLDGAARDRRDLIEIAALAVAAVESLDRQTPAPLSDEERRELDDLLALLVLPPSFTAREREIAVVVARQMQAELKRKAQPSPELFATPAQEPA